MAALDLGAWTIASIVVGFLAILPSIMGLFGKNKFDVNGKTVLLTGASEGMGRSAAIQLAQKGANVIIVARNVAKLEEALAQVKAAALNPSSQRFQYISADVADDSSERVISEAIAWNNGQAPDIVWCVAGSSHPSIFLETSRAIKRQQMDINYWSCADMAQAILSKWLAPGAMGKGGPKHLIFTSSVAAFYPIAGYASYAPAKAAIRCLGDSLAQEILLYGGDVKIHTVFPGTINSPGLINENKTKPGITFQLEEGDPGLTPDDMAAGAIKGLERGEHVIVVGILGQIMRAACWGCSPRNNWLWDTFLSWIIAIVWFFVPIDMDGKVRAYGKKHGHPSTYPKMN
ncbi:3-dehydrosphinganine reductase [Cadophora gregata]|uniref:3-dehydrosphinganine reductase n=1 Tax=Cadophora gregata TaxID=51156 RepID=UPI0026DD6CA7|nr:3-dehydrosphinganine reductase [Cadophora gregata]KAK0116524.1 3-dehydrosphinganine reductase [Cadophora gregata]